MSQKIINNEVSWWIQTLKQIYQALLDLWAMTPIELKMYIAAMFIVSILMQYIKKSFLTKCTKKERIQKLWAISFPLGIILSVMGVYLYADKIHMGYFILTGLTVSTISMGIHRVVVDYIWPAIKAIVGWAWERLTLFVRGKPKDA